MARKTFKGDIVTMLIYLSLMLLGWLTIYAVSNASGEVSLFDFKAAHGKQLIWIGISFFVLLVILALDSGFLRAMSYPIYGLSLLLLVVVLFVGRDINGAKSWLELGSFRFQPSELAKVATAMALAKFISESGFSFKNTRKLITAFAIIAVPALIIIAQNDTGSALVFGSFLFVFFREGLNPLLPLFVIAVATAAIFTLAFSPLIAATAILILAGVSFWMFFDRRKLGGLLLAHLLGIVFFVGLAFATDLIVSKLPQHQHDRIMVLFHPHEVDPKGRHVGYNVKHSQIAIGSGGFSGKGFMKGNYTKLDRVPMQDTDFIFCTIGEEQGWLGSFFILGLFLAFLARIRYIGEHAKMRYARIYAYGVMGVFFFHVMINIGMTIGLVPVIGIPLPFFSYGGSSLLSFTILLAVLINMYSYRSEILGSRQ